MWLFFAIISSVFASLTAIFAKLGIEDVNSNLATAIRTVVVLLLSWMMVFFVHAQKGIGQISWKSWIFLILSGLSTGASWLCYYKAMQIGDVSEVAAVDKFSIVITMVLAFTLLHETTNVKSILACILIAGGTILMAL